MAHPVHLTRDYPQLLIIDFDEAWYDGRVAKNIGHVFFLIDNRPH